MVTFLDTGLLSIFSVIFSLILIYVVVWGVLSWKKPFGDNQGLYALFSIAVAFFFVISPPARNFVEFVTPWFLALAIVFFLIVIVVSVFADAPWEKLIKENNAMQTWLIIVIALVIVAGLAFTFGQSALEAQVGGSAPPQQGSPQGEDTTPPPPNANGGSQTFQDNLISTVFHPQVLGILLVFLLASMIIFFLSKPVGGLD